MKKLYFLMACIFIAANMGIAQTKKKPTSNYNKKNKENDKFLEKQWWLGVKGGGLLSKANVQHVYSIVTPTNYDASTGGKKYENFKQLGSQIGFEVTFSFKGVSISLQPTYQHSRFVYTNMYKWSDVDNQNNQLQLNYKQEQIVDHALIPLVVKYEISGNRLRPYVQIGGYSAILLNANKSVTVSGVDHASGGGNTFSDEPIIVGAKDLFAKNYWGAMAGAGLYYDLGNVRLNLDVQYKYGMTNISSAKNRYSNDRLTGVGDALDDLTLDNLSFAVGCLFPLRFLESGFKSLDNK